MNKLNNAFDELQNAINDCQSDMSKFVEGNNSAGTRIRKAMQSVKTMAQGIRVEVQEQKNAAFQEMLLNEERELNGSLFLYLNEYNIILFGQIVSN